VVNPQTVNVGIIVPLTGADVDLWGENDVNPNMVAIDGFIGGVQTVAVTGAAPVTLTAPAGFTATPTPGPTQSQNRVLRFTGVLTANQVITLPLPGVYVVENLTTGNFVLSFRGVTATEVVGIQQGDRVTIYNDGANVRFVDLGKMGMMEFWAGLTALPAWVAACTVPPYLLCDGIATYTFSQFPYLGARMGSAFGGNGVTTFGTPDMRGRYPLAYDATGVRVTAGVSGLNGQTMGASLDAQSVTLTIAQMPAHYHNAGIYDPTHTHASNGTGVGSSTSGGGAFTVSGFGSVTINNAATGVRVNSSNGLDTTYATGGNGSHNNIPNTQVAGIWVIKT
jgi:microcystin-dependent protein